MAEKEKTFFDLMKEADNKQQEQATGIVVADLQKHKKRLTDEAVAKSMAKKRIALNSELSALEARQKVGELTDEELARLEVVRGFKANPETIALEAGDIILDDEAARRIAEITHKIEHPETIHPKGDPLGFEDLIKGYGERHAPQADPQ